MNTCALYYKHAGSINPHKNVCFVNDEMKLYDMIENGQVKGKDIFNWKTFYVDEFSNSMLGFFFKGLNEDVLKTLIKFYLMKPAEPQFELRPYLSPERYIANVSDTKRRLQVEKNFKHLMSNRPLHLPKPEIYHWEKIYKVIRMPYVIYFFGYLLLF